ncbi:hypothetical protein SBA4_7660006 [Candidatus Sulfopaludibacter sp. SbA4]|nr:hypothetical protein SBA4_7660006 [Candidatus Sulfopaludibacter sp. SbA4]
MCSQEHADAAMKSGEAALPKFRFWIANWSSEMLNGKVLRRKRVGFGPHPPHAVRIGGAGRN